MPRRPYSRLKLLPGWKRVVRDDLALPRSGRLARRRSLLYFAQLTDFQLADEESPARAEILDIAGSPFQSAWRPQEALAPFTVDEAVRQVNRFGRSPLRHRRTRHASLALTITTGDSADNQQVNEVELGRAAARGRAAEPELRRRGRRLRRARRPSRRGGALHRRAGRRRRARVRALLRPRPPVGRVRRLAALPGPHGPRAAAVRGGGPEPPELRRVRQPRRHRAGQHPRAAGARRHRARLRQAAVGERDPDHRRALHEPAAHDRRAARPRPPASPTARRTRRCTRRASRPTRTASASSTRPSSRRRAGRPPTTRSARSPACG